MKAKNKMMKRAFKCSLLALASAIQLVHAGTEFNSAFLSLGDHPADDASLEAVERGYDIMPGQYQFSIYLNREHIDDRTVKFFKDKSNQVVPCITPDFLKDYGILLNEEQNALIQDKSCLSFSELIPNANVSYDAGLQRLDLSIPQINLEFRPRGYIPEKMYNEGINAAILNYSFSGSHVKNEKGDDFNSFYAILNGGVNFGAWRYRNQSSFTSQSRSKNKWQSISNKIERDILPWQSRLEIGDAYTNSDVFDSFSFRGIQLSSDELQLPYGIQNYAPVVRGVASTNAVVEIRQNGYVIYSTNVAPGEFEIKDIVSSNDSGDLDVRIIESNGQVKEFKQPYSAVPNMLRPGRWKYQVTAGRYRTGNYDNDYQPYFGKATVAYGLNNRITPYGGLLIADAHYQSAGLGVGLSLGQFGAFSADATYANNKLASGGSSDGASFRFLYSKSLNEYGTNFKVIGYRYSTRGFYDFADAVSERSQWQNGYYSYSYLTQNNDQINTLTDDERRRYYYSSSYYNKKNQIQIALSQSLGQFGQVYANVSNIDYWNDGQSQRNWQVGYNTYIKGSSVGFYYQRNKSQFIPSDYSVGLNVTIPLGRATKNPHNYTSTSSYQYNEQSGSMVQTGISANFLKDKNLMLQAQTGYSDRNKESLYLSSSYQGSHADVDASYSYSDNYQQVAGNLRGGILVHSDGIVFGRQMMGSPILVEAKGAEGVRIENQPGLAIGKDGYALINSSNAYRRNRVALRAEDLGTTVNVEQNVERDIVPTKDAIVKVKFDVSRGQNMLAHLSFADGKNVTLGASIFNKDNKNLGIVGTDGTAYIVSIQAGEELVARWGDDASEQCKFTVPELNDKSFGYTEANIECK
ncbi:fimbria/pilus outer membrane usher protein [Acinetobacter oleivorans]|uniref:fimbria/pilus outer membrane usher protein n=1 Tax=Acinetobacter oleivorans TaxID=1148157 RepID=UPI001CD3BEF7|nr:fimbria/pilus outer membrane usher protein [Acinetobacter oleivorans]